MLKEENKTEYDKLDEYLRIFNKEEEIINNIFNLLKKNNIFQIALQEIFRIMYNHSCRQCTVDYIDITSYIKTLHLLIKRIKYSSTLHTPQDAGEFLESIFGNIPKKIKYLFIYPFNTVFSCITKSGVKEYFSKTENVNSEILQLNFLDDKNSVNMIEIYNKNFEEIELNEYAWYGSPEFKKKCKYSEDDVINKKEINIFKKDSPLFYKNKDTDESISTYLIIHLSRTIYIGDDIVKISTKISEYDEIKIDDIEFILIGVIIHSGGSAGGGHYVYNLHRNPIDLSESLKTYNDKSISDKHTYDSDNGSIFLYKRKN